MTGFSKLRDRLVLIPRSFAAGSVGYSSDEEEGDAMDEDMSEEVCAHVWQQPFLLLGAVGLLLGYRDLLFFVGQ